MLMNIFSVFFVTLLFISSSYAEVETAIPLSRSGHAYHRGNTSSLTTVDLFIDLTCSACQEEWPTITQVYQAYKDKVHFLYRVFPLPYHQQAFITAKAAQVVNFYGKEDAVFTFFDTAYAKQAEIYNSVTADLTYNDVVSLVEKWAVADTGVTSEQYYTGMNSSTTIGSQLEMNARYIWKYTTLQGVYATPFFAIDGLKALGLDTFDDWKAALDPLVL